MSPERNFRFTVEERILLHLLDYVRLKNEVELPQTLTQEGIAGGVAIQRKHVPRALKGMEEKEQIEERMAHVSGKSQRMKTYHLSPSGEKSARRIRVHARELQITVKEGAGTRDCCIADFRKACNEAYTLAEVLSYVSLDGVFVIESVQEPMSKSISSGEKKDNIEIYRRVLDQAWKDGVMTSDEMDILLTLKESLGISGREHALLEKDILEAMGDGINHQALEVYRAALEQALADGRLSKDEEAILDSIRKKFNIPE